MLRPPPTISLRCNSGHLFVSSANHAVADALIVMFLSSFFPSEVPRGLLIIVVVFQLQVTRYLPVRGTTHVMYNNKDRLSDMAAVGFYDRQPERQVQDILFLPRLRVDRSKRTNCREVQLPPGSRTMGRSSETGIRSQLVSRKHIEVIVG